MLNMYVVSEFWLSNETTLSCVDGHIMLVCYAFIYTNKAFYLVCYEQVNTHVLI